MPEFETLRWEQEGFVATIVPMPRLLMSSPLSTNCFKAALIVGRLIPSCSARSSSPSSLLPRGSRPSSMARSSACAAWW